MKLKKNIFIPIFLILTLATICSFYFLNSQARKKEINQLEKEKVIKKEEQEIHVAEVKQHEDEIKFSILDFKEFFDEDELPPEYSKKNECYFSTIDMYCLRLDEVYENIENDKFYYYVTISGRLLQDDEEGLESHATPGLLKLFKFKNENNQIIKIAESEILKSGVRGLPPNLSLITINSNNEMAWSYEERYSNQGYTQSVYVLFKQNGKNVSEIFSMPIYANDFGIGCKEELDTNLEEIEKSEVHENNVECDKMEYIADIKIIPNKNDYFTIEALVTGNNFLFDENSIDNKSEISEKKFIIKYDKKLKKYIRPARIPESII
jgi:hypothetical protein